MINYYMTCEDSVKRIENFLLLKKATKYHVLFSIQTAAYAKRGKINYLTKYFLFYENLIAIYQRLLLR